MQIGVSLTTSAASLDDLPVAPPVDPPVDPPSGLQAPQNLFDATASAFDVADHIDGRGNWEVSSGRLVHTGADLGKDARINLPSPMTAGHAYFATYDSEISDGNIKMGLGGDGAFSGRAVNDPYQAFEYYPAPLVTGNFTRIGPKPNNSFVGSIDDIALFDLSSTDPHAVVCDVIIVGGDSNASNATSEFVTKDNRETPYDPRLWYMPCLRSSPTFGPVGAVRHEPFPMIEPVISAATAYRMSPVHAAASRVVGWSAARGRPLLVMALGDAGSGLMNTQDWRRPDRAVIENTQQQNTASRMWNEMIAMKAAVEALGPAHEVVGAIWSLGQNDGFNAPDGPEDYDTAHTPAYHDFFSDLRGVFGNIPVVMTNIAQHIVDNTDSQGNPGFGSYRQAWINRFDQGSGHPNAIQNFTVIQPPDGNQVDPLNPSDPHYNAHGMQVNGRLMGDTLLSML